MNKVLLAVGILSASVAVGQTTRTTKSSSNTVSPSNYNNSNTNNYNSSNASSASGSSYTGTSGSMSTGTTGTYNSNGTYNNSTAVTPSGSNNYNTMGTTTTDTYSTTNPSGSMNNGSMSTGTTGTYNSNGTYNNSTTVTPSGSSNYNTMGTSGATTTPSTSYDTNSMNSGTSATSNYSTGSYSTSSTRTAPDPAGRNGYNNFAFGIYAGLNATNFKGESIDAENPSSRLGYQAGFFVRGGGRLYGQIGAEYFASSSNYFRAANGSSTQAIRDYINIQYIQVPVYIGYKLTESERGNSAIRIQAGVEYANRISSDSRSFNLSKDEIKSGTFNALGQLGFDFGPFLIDLTYHHGLGNAVQINTFQGSSRRILSASVGFKF